MIKSIPVENVGLNVGGLKQVAEEAAKAVTEPVKRIGDKEGAASIEAYLKEHPTAEYNWKGKDLVKPPLLNSGSGYTKPTEDEAKALLEEAKAKGLLK